jgi:titin
MRFLQRHSPVRITLLAALCQVLAAACDPTAPVDPASDASRLLVPDESSMRNLVPSGPSATARSWDRIDISWTKVQNASGYQVFQSTTGASGSYALIASTGATVTAYSNAGLTASTEYCYKIRSIKTAGRNITYSDFSAAACATTSPPPVASPSETDAVPQGYKIQIRWKDNSTNEDGFHIQRAPTPNGAWEQALDAVANATSADVYASLEQQACFRVVAYSTAGPSSPSVPDCTALPAAPSQLSANAPDPQSITLSWTDNSGVEDGFRVYRMEEGGAWADIATLPANVASYRDAGVKADVPYTYHVQALKDGGYSNFSNDAVGVIPTTVPAAPTNAEAFFQLDVAINAFTFYVGWSDNSINEQGFRIENTDGRGGWYPWVDTLANVSFVAVAFLPFQDPVQICVRIVAFNALGDSSPSNEVCADTYGFPGFGDGTNIVANPTTPLRVKGSRKAPPIPGKPRSP